MKKHLSFFSAILCLLLSVCGTARAQPGITWTAQTTPIPTLAWSNLAYGNGLYVAVSTSGTGSRVMTSPDGIIWTLRTTPTDNQWYDITFGNGLFVAVAGNGTGTGDRVMTSPDGINWTIRTTPADNIWNGVIYANGQFVAVATSGTAGNRVMTSPDGITWTLRVAANSYAWTSVAYGNGLYVSVAAGGIGNRVMTSSDGISWASRSSAANNQWLDIVFANGLFVAVAVTGTGNRVMTSPDGINWTAQSTPADNNWRSVTFGAGLFVAVANTGTGNRVMTSPDGINWTLRTSASDNNWVSVVYGASEFVAVGTTGTGDQVMTSGSVVVGLQWLSVNARLNSADRPGISWQVEEQNVTDYNVEKSTDGRSFTTIGSVAGLGDGRHSYTFTESQKLTGTAYYRIKQIDRDGRATYSSILTLHNSDHQISIYPNPARDFVTVSVSNYLLNKNAIVTDLSGKVLQTIKINSLSFTVNIAQYPAGTYFIKAENENPVKIIKE
jgi:predicted RecA/RadA family phage recombinase